MSSISQLARRTCAEIQDLKMIKIEQEYDSKKLKTNILREEEFIHRCTPVTQVERRFYDDMEALLIDKMQFTYDSSYLIAKGMRIVRPFKIYKQVYKVLPKYDLKIKH